MPDYSRAFDATDRQESPILALPALSGCGRFTHRYLGAVNHRHSNHLYELSAFWKPLIQKVDQTLWGVLLGKSEGEQLLFAPNLCQLIVPAISKLAAGRRAS